MLLWLKGLSSLKLGLLVAGVSTVIAGATGFVAGQRWVKGELYDDAVQAIDQLAVAAQDGLNSLNERWLEEAKEAQIDINEWNLQNQIDNDLFQELIAGQVKIRSDFRELENTIRITDDVGTCVFSVDALRLLRAASEKANSGSGATDSGAGTGTAEESAADSGDGGV